MPMKLPHVLKIINKLFKLTKKEINRRRFKYIHIKKRENDKQQYAFNIANTKQTRAIDHSEKM